MSSVLDIFSTLNGVVGIFNYATAAGADEHLNEKLYMILPEDSQKYAELASEDVFVLTEENILLLKKAENLIEEYCRKSGKEFNNFEEKLYYCASVMPEIVSEGTKYERTKHEKVTKIDFSKS